MTRRLLRFRDLRMDSEASAVMIMKVCVCHVMMSTNDVSHLSTNICFLHISSLPTKEFLTSQFTNMPWDSDENEVEAEMWSTDMIDGIHRVYMVSVFMSMIQFPDIISEGYQAQK